MLVPEDLNPYNAASIQLTIKIYKNLIICSLWSNMFVVEDIGVEPMTPCVQGRCSSQLS